MAAHGITDDEQRIAMKAMIDAVIERSEILRNRLLNLSCNKPEVQSWAPRWSHFVPSRARLGPARNSVARLSDHIISIRHSEGDYNMRAAG
jgi:hypothetical protein